MAMSGTAVLLARSREIGQITLLETRSAYRGLASTRQHVLSTRVHIAESRSMLARMQSCNDGAVLLLGPIR